MSVSRVVIAAPASGCGKTTVAMGLMAALAARGHTVSPHKVGPDYIDPSYHELAAGRPGRNLDPWLTGEELIAPLFRHGTAGAGIAVIEGVMGLFDGARADDGFASTAHVAALLGAPVVLVVDAAAAGRSVAALVHGFATYDPAVRIGGVILNRLGSDGHERLCREAVESVGVPVLGTLRRRDDVAMPSRHLGLVPAAERAGEARRTVRRLGELIAGSCDVEGLLRLAATAPDPPGPPWDPARAVRPANPDRPVIAVAGGPAFTFGYTENAELLTAAGADVAAFDPLADERLPDGARGIVIGGGFPEAYAAELAANEPLRAAIREAGVPVYAECAGLLYLARELDGHPMCGVIDAKAGMTDRLALGYREAVAADSVVARAGEGFRGHEFHRTEVEPGHGEKPAWRWRGAAQGFARHDLIASYLHLHWAGSPEVAERFVEACE